jgi:hypothetical protein
MVQGGMMGCIKLQEQADLPAALAELWAGLAGLQLRRELPRN